MTWLVFAWALTVGWMPQNLDILEADSQLVSIDTSGAFVQTIELEAVANDRARLWTNIETRELAVDALRYAPFRSVYRVGAEVFGRSWAAGVRHECIHPVVSWMGGDDDQDLGPAGKSTEFYVTIRGRTR